MRDVSFKTPTLRTATAQAVLKTSENAIGMIQRGEIPKGDPLIIARIAGVQGAKLTPQLIPYCHTVALEHVTVDFELGQDSVLVIASAKAIDKTGVEMEAMMAATIAALNIYDMLKMLGEPMEILKIELLSKRGGKSDFPRSTGQAWRAGVLVISDSVVEGRSEDRSGATLRKGLEAKGFEVVMFEAVSDEPAQLQEAFLRLCDQEKLDLIVTTGGTGLGPRDNTPQTIGALLDRDIPGFAEALREYGQARTPYAMLSRLVAGTRGETLAICLPGSTSAVEDALQCLMPAALHALEIMRGAGHPQ